MPKDIFRPGAFNAQKFLNILKYLFQGTIRILLWFYLLCVYLLPWKGRAILHSDKTGSGDSILEYYLYASPLNLDPHKVQVVSLNSRYYSFKTGNDSENSIINTLAVDGMWIY